MPALICFVVWYTFASVAESGLLYLSAAAHILKKYWGYDAFRPLQEDIINSILQGKDTLALLPTGGGKSVCYQVPALMMDGMCLVISPLIALMQDQVGRLQQLGIAAACIHSGLHHNDVVRMLADAVHGAYKLLYVSPERLRTEMFKDHLPELDLSMLAIDEAHCISQWGHDFRPAYLGIGAVRDVHRRIPLLALTASATQEVKEDIIVQAGMRAPQVFRSSFARSNIFYEIAYSENKSADVLRELTGACSIVYCRSRRQTETFAGYVQHQGMNSTVYHAGLSKESRDEAQERWMTDQAPVMIATTAFGMGIDKPGVRQVAHYDAPEHPEAYYQEAGRAGRDGKPSRAYAVYNSADIKRLEDSIALQYPPEAYLRQVYQSVADYLQVPISAQPDRYYPFDLHEFCLRFKLQATQAIYALKLLEREGLWTLTESVYSPATIRFTADRHTLDSLQRSHPQLGYMAVNLLRMYNGVFHHPVHIRELAIARQLRMQKEDVVKALERLAAMELLEYNKPGEGPQLFFHHYRVDSRHLRIDMRRIGDLRRQHEKRTRAMTGMLENRTECRERLLLQYFDEQPDGDCGHCDVCRDKHTASMSNKELRAVLLNDIKQNGVLTANELAALYAPNMREQVFAVLREMIDMGKLGIEPGGIKSVD